MKNLLHWGELVKLRIWWNKRIVLSRRYGILYYISRMIESHKQINVVRDRIKNSAHRGNCAWCTFPITKLHSCHQICNTCQEFKPKLFLHTRCIEIEDSCGGCKLRKYMIERKRIQ